MEQKTISINPNLFTMSGKKEKKKKELPLKLTKPTNMKKELIKKIKNYQNKTRKRRDYPMNEQFHSEFQDSINYLRSVIQEKQQTNSDVLSDTNSASSPNSIPTSNLIVQPNSNPNPNPNPNNHPNPNPIPLEGSNQNPIPIKTQLHPDVPYGNLKNGNKPTWRTWVRNQSVKLPRERSDNADKELQNYANAEKLETPSIVTDLEFKTQKETKKAPRRLKKKTIRKKYTCGKSKTKKQISILIKDIKTKNKVLQEKRDLRQASMQEIKNYLYRKSFIKTGSTAPDKVLRDMYESIILTGIVSNLNTENMVHNFLNGDNV